MKNLEPLDVEFLALGASGWFDEQSMAASELSRLGTGRMLDVLGSMLERGLLLRQDGGFVPSEEVRAYLWDCSTALRIRMLRLLEILPLDIPRIKSYLDEDQIEGELRSLQEQGLVQSYPVLQGGVPVPVFQSTQKSATLLGHKYDAAAEIAGIICDVSELEADPRRDAILERLKGLAKHLSSRSSDRGSGLE